MILDHSESSWVVLCDTCHRTTVHAVQGQEAVVVVDHIYPSLPVRYTRYQEGLAHRFDGNDRRTAVVLYYVAAKKENKARSVSGERLLGRGPKWWTTSWGTARGRPVGGI
jgi:hypothetical protein